MQNKFEKHISILKQSSLIETACRFAWGFVVEFLLQEQMSGFCVKFACL